MREIDRDLCDRQWDSVNPKLTSHSLYMTHSCGTARASEFQNSKDRQIGLPFALAAMPNVLSDVLLVSEWTAWSY